MQIIEQRTLLSLLLQINTTTIQQNYRASYLLLALSWDGRWSVVSWLEGIPQIIGSLRDATLGMPFGGWLAALCCDDALRKSVWSSYGVLQMLKFLWVRTWRHVWVLARWYMAEERFVARSVSRSQSLLSSVPASRLIAVRPPESFFQSNCSCGRSPAPHGFFLCIHYPPIYFVTWRKYI